MANGSFGLSGFPTAPTTTSGSGGGANNPAASVTATVQSADGFAAGELIYQRNNSFGTIPDNFASSATFPLTNNVPVMGGNVLSQGTGASSYVQNLNTFGYNIKSMSTSAKLTNGNIVFAFRANATSTATGWATTANAAHFKIVSESGATVVDTTLVSSATLPAGAQIGVTALATGGFVVCYINSASNYLTYAIYNNSGVVTTALTIDSTNTLNSGGWLDVQTRSDGSWIVAVANSAGNLAYKVFSSTGTQVYAWTTSWLLWDVINFNWQVIVRSDNSWVLLGAVTNAATLQYAVYSSTNTLVSGPTSFTVNGGGNTSGGCFSASLLTDGRIVFTTAYSGTVSNIYYRTLSTGNVLSSESVLVATTVQGIQNVRTFATSSGGLLLYVPTAYNPTLFTSYWAFDSSLQNIFGGTQSLKSVFLSSGSFYYIPTFFETSNYIGAIIPNEQFGMSYIRFDKTNLFLNNFAQQSLSSGTSGSLPVSGYSRSGSTPSGASFLSSSTSVSVSSISASSTFLVGPVTVDSTTVVDSDSTTFTNGNFAIVYRNNAGVVAFKVYSSAGVLITTVPVSSSAITSNTVYYTKIIQLENGKIVVVYPTAGSPTTLTIAVYSSAYALLGSTSFAPGADNNLYNVSIAPIYGSRILIQYSNSSAYSCFVVYSDTPALLTSQVVIDNSGVNGYNRCAPTSQGFIVSFTRQSGANYFASYYESAPNTWTRITLSAFNNTSGGMWYNPKINAQPNGIVWTPTSGNTTAENIQNYYFYSNGSATTATSVGTGVAHNSYTAVANCVTAYGTACWVNYQSSTTLQFATFETIFKTSSPTSTLTLTFPSLQINGQYCLTPLRNSQVALSYVVGSSLNFVILEAGCVQYFAKITSGVSSSSPVALAQQTGATLLGVSTTAATAGGTGTVQINGPATLNANYSTTQSSAFDFQNPVTFGVKGVVNGLNVNLQGNV